ncbi:MAG: PAS domain S-box protein, partial [Thermodesulfobacteriota bacterium]
MRLRLSYRINLYIACILIAGAAVLTFHDYIFREMVMEETGIKEAERLSKVVFGELYHAMQTEKRREANRDVIERFKRVSSVKDIKIIHGLVIDAQFGTEKDETASDENERKAIGGVAVAMEEPGFIRYIMPVFIKAECRRCHVAKEGDVAGAVAVTLSTERFREIAALKTKYFIALNALILLLTASAIFYILRVRLTSPLGRLKKAADAISSGDLSHRVRIESGDELEDVGSAFDRMAENLSLTTSGLKELNEKYSKLIENSPNAIVLYDARAKKISDVNLMAEALTGYSRSELLSMRPDDMYLPDNLARYAVFRERWIQDGKGYFFETPIKKKDGSTAWIEISAALMDVGGKPFVQEIWRDLSERRTFANALRDYAEGLEKKVRTRTAELNSSLETLELYKNELEKAYAKLKDSEKILVESAKLASLGEMGAGIAHELNSPLAGILSITEVLIKRSAADDPNRHLLETMKDAAVRSKDIIRDMLT